MKVLMYVFAVLFAVTGFVDLSEARGFGGSRGGSFSRPSFSRPSYSRPSYSRPIASRPISRPSSTPTAKPWNHKQSKPIVAAPRSTAPTHGVRDSGGNWVTNFWVPYMVLNSLGHQNRTIPAGCYCDKDGKAVNCPKEVSCKKTDKGVKSW